MRGDGDYHTVGEQRGGQMNARIPRLMLNELSPELQEALHPRVRRLNYLGELFQCLGHQPEALLAFMEFTGASKGALDQRLVEVIALTVATMKDNEYERNQHERLSVRLGFGREWVAEVEALDPDHAGILDEADKTIQRFVIATVKQDGKGVSCLLDDVVEALGHVQAVAVLMVVARYVTHAVMVNSLALDPPVPSIFEHGIPDLNHRSESP